MTAPKEIERWVPSEGMDSLSLFPDLSWPGLTEYVTYSDHLRAVTLAKIEVLEEECDASDAEDIEFADPSVQRYAIRREQWRESRIAALRKELEG